MTTRFSIFAALIMVIAIVAAAMMMMMMIMTATTTEHFPCDNYMQDIVTDTTSTTPDNSSSVNATSSPRAMGCRFRQHVNNNNNNDNRTYGDGGVSITNEGRLRRDRDTPFWSMFSDAFGVSSCNIIIYAFHKAPIQ